MDLQKHQMMIYHEIPAAEKALCDIMIFSLTPGDYEWPKTVESKGKNFKFDRQAAMTQSEAGIYCGKSYYREVKH